jgi:hypothetical protein
VGLRRRREVLTQNTRVAGGDVFRRLDLAAHDALALAARAGAGKIGGCQLNAT